MKVIVCNTQYSGAITSQTYLLQASDSSLGEWTELTLDVIKM